MNDGYDVLGLGVIKEPAFYFVNVPQKYNTALIFPVGIDDAVWFSYKESKFATHSVSTLDQARKESSANQDAKVFVFDNKGKVSIKE